VPAARPDPRSDPRVEPRRDQHATQRISREQLDEALNRTKSGTRLAVRSSPDLTELHDPAAEPRDPLASPRDSFAGPRDDDGPQITIVRIDSVELSTIDPSIFPTVVAPSQSQAPVMVIPTPGFPNIDTTARASSTSSPRVVSRRGSWTHQLPLSPRAAFFAGLTVAMIVLLAACVGFLFGRGVTPGH
jgi:hypothetical protein